VRVFDPDLSGVARRAKPDLGHAILRVKVGYRLLPAASVNLGGTGGYYMRMGRREEGKSLTMSVSENNVGVRFPKIYGFSMFLSNRPKGGSMKTSVKVFTCIAFLIALLAVSCGSTQTTEGENTAVENEPAAPENELIGVWKFTAAEVFGENAETITDIRPSILIFTPKYFSWIDVHGEHAPDLTEEPTDAQLAAAYNQLTAMAGTYEVEGSSITAPIIVSANPNEMSGNEVYNISYRFEGDILVFTLEAYNLELKMARLE
jgi:hypothetical protein